MRILYHHRTRGLRVEGVHIRGIVHALRELGHAVTVMSFPGADPEHAPVTSSEARSGWLGGLVSRLPGIVFEFFELAYNLVTWPRMALVIRRQRPQLIYERYSMFLFATVWLARRRGVPIILEINDSALVERVRPLSLKRLARHIEGWCFRRSTGLVFISTYFMELARSTYGDIAHSVVSPNAADLDRFNPEHFDASRLRAERGLGNRVVCGHIGAFALWHGMDKFMDAITPRLGEVPELTLVLVGDGRTLPAIREMVDARGLGNRVLFAGQVAHDDIPAWIACMDYAVLPDSNEYGSPMKLFEFMAMGVAMVAPDYAPIVEVVDDGRSGWLFRRREVDACVQRVIELAMSAEERRRVGQAARERIVHKHQWSSNAEQLLSLLSTGGSG